MKTIRGKLFLIFMIVMVFLILFGICLNSMFLESYYIYKNKGIFLSVSEKVSNEYINNIENVDEYINNIDSLEGITVTILDQDFNIEYNSFHQKQSINQKILPEEIKQTILDNKEIISKKYIYRAYDIKNDQKTKLIFISQISNGNFIILKKPIKSIKESVSIANEFYILAGIIVMCIGSIFIIIFSKKITTPIKEMSNVAENISNLEFDKRLEIKSKDEIGKLGESINKISEKLCISINELKQDVEQRKQLVRDMSHELKTPIGIIKGYAEGLKYGVVNDKKKMQKYCSVLVDECDRMDKLVRELLNHSAIEYGMIEINRTSFESDEFVSSIVTRFNPIFIDKGINFDLEYTNNFLISADREMLEKAVNNFITNAIHHLGGRKIIRLTVEDIENLIRVSVFNTGSHIPIEDFDKIWDVYYKVDKARSRTYGGHGLGLSIVKLVTKLHNGVTKVENIDDGVMFSLEIPN